MNLERPEAFYRYLPYNQEHLRQAICEGRLKFSNPTKFNDPWDCHPNFATFDTYSKNQIQEARKRLRGTLLRHSHLMGGRKSARKHLIQNRDIDQTITAITLGTQQFVFAERRILSLTIEKDNILLWSHSAQNHMGVCLQFSTRYRLFRLALRVTYHEDWPLIYVGQNPAQLVDAVFLHKSSHWSYENEYRIVSVERRYLHPDEEKPARQGMLAVTENDFLHFPRGSLDAIIVGCRASHETVSEILEMIKYSNSSARLLKAVKNSGKYSLDFEDISA
jgi:hypothetical protein